MIPPMDELRSPLPDVDGEKDYLFDAVLQPHTSLNPRGFMLLMLAIVSVSFVAGMAFMLAGAWPVFGFFGLDCALVYLAFRANYRWARMYETIRLTEDTLLVERISPSGRVQRWRFQPYWLKVDIDRPVRHDSQLVLSSHGRRLKVGAFLTPDERVELADALRDALDRLRRPSHSHEVSQTAV
jgi:uncharacterized membrane protein